MGDLSDDYISAALAIYGAVEAQQSAKREKKARKVEKRRAAARLNEPEKETATAVDRGSETARRNRQRRRAAAGEDLGPLTLGTPGLLGESQGF